MFLHGLESGPHGAKWEILSQKYDGVLAPDCRGLLDVEDRVTKCLRELRSPAYLVGSSFGGLVAGLIATRHPQLVRGLLLAAPAFHKDEASEIDLLKMPLFIIHGVNDKVVPVEYSRLFQKRQDPMTSLLVEVDDGHRLQHSRDVFMALADELIPNTD